MTSQHDVLACAADLLGVEGPFAREIPGFASRVSQQVMAAAVEEASGVSTIAILRNEA